MNCIREAERLERNHVPTPEPSEQISAALDAVAREFFARACKIGRKNSPSTRRFACRLSPRPEAVSCIAAAYPTSVGLLRVVSPRLAHSIVLLAMTDGMHGATGGAPTGKRNGNYRHGTRTKEAIEAVRLVNLLSRLARKS